MDKQLIRYKILARLGDQLIRLLWLRGWPLAVLYQSTLNILCHSIPFILDTWNVIFNVKFNALTLLTEILINDQTLFKLNPLNIDPISNLLNKMKSTVAHLEKG